MKCPFCGTNNQPGDDFCSNCGAYLKAPASGSADATIASSPVSISATSVSGTPAATTTAAAGSAINSGTLTPNTALQNGRYVVEKVL
ncbi:MAG: zinc ribbon domain-containing protein, partial [Ktedonobacteraceae bacterium]|nr:zinc ribbon domain-containing protein [Ktedonobacteraceae bacterium]